MTPPLHNKPSKQLDADHGPVEKTAPRKVWHLSVANHALLDHHIQDVPPELQQSHIHRGYRWNLTAKQCFMSIFKMHNDTINVWTHFLGAMYFAFVGPSIMEAMPQLATHIDRTLMMVYIFSAFVCHMLSACYHTFKGTDQDGFTAWYRLDLTGIVVLIAGSNFVGIYNAFYDDKMWILIYNVPLAIMLGMAVFFTNAPAYRGRKYDEHRTLTLAASVAIGGLPMAHWLFFRCWGLECFWEAASPTLILGFCYGMGFVFFYFRIPECFAPGRFDTFLHSHQWWHVFVFAAAYVWLHGMLSYTNWRVDNLAKGLAAATNTTTAA